MDPQTRSKSVILPGSQGNVQRVLEHVLNLVCLKWNHGNVLKTCEPTFDILYALWMFGSKSLVIISLEVLSLH